MRPWILSLLSATLLFLLGVLVINGQLWTSSEVLREKGAQHAVLKIETILHEAEKAQTFAKQVAAEGCTAQGQFELGTQAALLPHLRTIIIIKDKRIWCSSLPGNGVLTIHPELFSDLPLLLIPRSHTVNNLPIMIMQAPLPGGRVMVTISNSHLRDALNSASGEIRMALVVGNARLQLHGDVSATQHAERATRSLTSKAYPFSIEYNPAPFFDLKRLLRQGWSLLVMMLLLAIGVEVLLKRYIDKNSSPLEELRQAIEKGEIVPFYQPVVNGKSGAIYGVEVLARWKSPQMGLLPPASFIPLAEQSGLIIPLTKSLMEQVARQMKPILYRLPAGFHIGLNVGAAHINSAGFMDDCTGFLDAFGEKLITLVLEVTEREPLLICTQLINKLNALHHKGLSIALDDFGTGYCGLSYLNELAIDYIKIDQSFVGRVSEEKDSTKLLDCVIELAKKLSLRIIAEGVETQEQLNYLNAHNITLLQGYYFSKPVSFSGLVMLLLSKQKEEIVIA